MVFFPFNFEPSPQKKKNFKKKLAGGEVQKLNGGIFLIYSISLRMLKITSSIQKDLDKRNKKEIRVYANKQTPIEILEDVVNNLNGEFKKLELEIITDEGTYGAVAKDKIDRKLK